MARIPDEVIERLKREISLERLVESSGVNLKRRGKDLVGLCPFHNDKDPSFIVTPSNNLFNCMGCDAGGTTIDFVKNTQGISFRHAAEVLINDFFPADAVTTKKSQGLEEGAAKKKISKRSTVPKITSPLEPDAEDHELSGQVIDYYQQKLKESPNALEYLADRGLVHGDLIDHFKLGYADRTLGYRLPLKNRVAGATIRGRLQKTGFIRQSGHEHLTGSLVVPIFDEHGNVAQAYGRKINDKKLRKGTAMHLYLAGPHRAVWNLDALKVSEEIILCESLIDALTFWVHGFRNVTTSYGIQGFQPFHLAAFQEYGVKRVLIAYDRDEPGNKAALKLAKKLMNAGIECFRILFPKGMDANEYALKLQPAPKALDLLIRKAEWMGKGQHPPLKEKTTTATNALPRHEEKAAKKKTDIQKPIPLAATQKVQVEKLDVPVQAKVEGPEPSKPVESSPVPTVPTSDVKAVVKADDVFITRGDRSYRVRNLEQNLSKNVMKVNCFAYCGDDYHVDVLNLYSAYHRSNFAKQASKTLGIKEEVVEKDLGKMLLKLEELQDAKIAQSLSTESTMVELSPQEKAASMDLLTDPNFISRLLVDFAACGVVGEETNKLVGYLVATSRLLEKPLGAMIQSSSASGKTTTMDAILSFIPKEDVIKYSAITGQALYYKGENDLRHKIIAIVEEEGAEKASYPLKLLLSEGELIIASTGKNQTTGTHATQDYHVKGPVAVFVTTTAVETDEEFQNRCLVLAVDESREQTRTIHQIQREKRTLKGLKRSREKQRILQMHQNAQRLLRPLSVVNPYALELTFLDDKTRMRRDQEKYLNLIDTCAYLHQYQREVKTLVDDGESLRYVEVTLADIELANKLAHEVLGRSLDELPPQTRKLLTLIHEMVSKTSEKEAVERTDIRFSRRDIREYCHWGNTQLKVHLWRLEDMEYLLIHRGKRGQSFVYELLYNGEGQNEESFLMGLLDVEKLRQKYGCDAKKSGLNDEKAVPSRPQVGPKSVPGRPTQNDSIILNQLPLVADAPNQSEKRELIGGYPLDSSYPQKPVVAQV